MMNTVNLDHPDNKLSVVFVCYENTLATSISLPMELLRAADTFAHTSNGPIDAPKLNIVSVSVDGQSKSTQTGLNIDTNTSIDNIKHADVIFLPAIWRNPFPVVKKNEKICGWLKKMFSRETTLIAGVGTGCCFMAEAGLLDNKAATTHWHFFDRFRKRYPAVNLKENYFITQAGRLYCTGSVNTLADLTVHFIKQHYGSAISTEVERHFFHDIRQNYDKLVLLDNQVDMHPDEGILECQSYIQTHFSSTINLNTIAQEAGMSRRNFDRRFRAATGLSPLNYLQKIRMDAAKELIKNTNLSISDVMFESGYQDIAHFASLFKKFNGASPSQYRKTVRAKLFSNE